MLEINSEYFKKVLWIGVYLCLKTCEVFLWFLAIIFPWLYFVDFSVASCAHCFTSNCEFHRFLHQGKDEYYNYTLKNDSNVFRRKPSLRVPELGPGATYSGFNKFHSLFK